MVGVVTLVMRSPFEEPLSLAGNSVRPVGATGIVVSMVRESAGATVETLLATSTSVAVRV